MKKFKDLFCAAVRCAPEAYEREVLKRTLYPHAARLGFLASWFCSPICRRVIEEAGEVESSEELRDVIKLYEYDIQLHGGFWMRRVKFRVSGQRLLDLWGQVRHEAERDVHGSPPPRPTGAAPNA